MQTGKVFRDRSLHSTKNVAYANQQIKHVVFSAHEEFENALDELEVQIVSRTEAAAAVGCAETVPIRTG